MDDLEEQSDEICVLESIFTPEELKIERDEEGKISGKFYAFVSVPENFNVSYMLIDLDNKDSDEREISSKKIPVSHLPPILLSFSLPPDYPSNSMPDYQLACSWLKHSCLVELSKRLECLWAENCGMVILYIWTQFLKEETLSYLNINETLDVTGFYIRKLRGLKTRVPSNKASPAKMSLKVQMLQSKHQDRISILPTPNMHLHEFLKAYSEDRTKTEFLRSLYSCDICFTEKLGSRCIQFCPCNHVYCKECIKSYFEVRIKSGSFQMMPCPYDKCSSEALQSQIRECVGPVLYGMYDKQLLSATLDKMEDITYCPRTACGSPVLRENDEKMAVCPKCSHVFCVFCKMTYHGVEPCRLKTEEKQKLLNDYENADEATRQRLEKRYGKRQIAILLADAKSESWISVNSKPCPKCNVAIEKSDGCNKMSCWKCGAFFCWLCLAELDPAYPYYHYIDPTSRCKSQLFEGTLDPEEGDEENENMLLLDDEDYDEEFDIEEAYFEGFDEDYIHLI